MSNALYPIKDRMLQIATDNSLVSNDINVTDPAVTATITVGAEIANARAITVQFKDANGAATVERVGAKILVMADANGDAFVTTGGSTGIAVGSNGALLTVVAKKYFEAVSEANGLLDLTWTDTGTEVAYLHVILPNGRRVVSSALTNA